MVVVVVVNTLHKYSQHFLQTEAAKCPARAVFTNLRARHVHVMSLNLLTQNQPAQLRRLARILKFCAEKIYQLYLGPSINGLVTDKDTKLCCRGFILPLFQSTTAIKIDSEHTRGYKRLLLVCEPEILRVT